MPRRTRKSKRKQIKQDGYWEASHTNNPPVGLVTLETNRDARKKTYVYDSPYGIKYGCNFQPFVNQRVAVKIEEIVVHQ